MSFIKPAIIFYLKIIVPNITISTLLLLVVFFITREIQLKIFGFSFIFFGFLIHYFIYEVKNYNEYYFYNNIGLSNLKLRIISFILSLIIGLSFILL
jgi:hypothetical protein